MDTKHIAAYTFREESYACRFPVSVFFSGKHW
jgi:hypothetical protein